MTLKRTRYQHSNTFAILKAVKETLEGNLSTVQYMRILDGYLYRALAPIVDGTNHADRCFTQLLAWHSANGKRKLSMDSSIDLQALTFQFLMTPRSVADLTDDAQPSERIKIIQSMKLDRAFLTYIINSFIDDLSTVYKSACDGILSPPIGVYGDNVSINLYVKARVEENYEIDPDGPSLLGLHQTVVFWREPYLEVKRVTLEKYVRLSLVNAQKDYAHYFSCSGVDLDDLSQTYLMMAARAIDRCDSDQGTLTTLIQSWHLTGRSNAQKERTRIAMEDYHVAPDDLEDEETIMASDDRDASIEQDIASHTRRVAELADPKGVGRFLLGLLAGLPYAATS